MTQKRKSNNTTAISTKPLPKKKIFPFDSLPAEIKNQIYELALTAEDGIFLISKTKHYRCTIQRDMPSFPHSVRGSTKIRRRYGNVFGGGQASEDFAGSAEPPELTALAPNILLLNREIYAQARPFLYSSNSFFLEDTTALHAFLSNIGPKNCASLTDLTIRGWGYSKAHKAMNHPAFTMLASAINLERLYIDCRIHQGQPMSTARQFYRDGFHYLEGIGTAKGRFDAAVNVIEISPENVESHRYRSDGTDEHSVEERMEQFRGELRKLLSSH